MLIRQVVSILVLPFAVTVVVPLWIARRSSIVLTAPRGFFSIGMWATGLVLAIAGLSLFCWSLYLFWIEGRGTLAPWDPPRRFVVSGPYRFVRNPMITGVALLLVAEACILRSTAHAEWAGLFALVNAIYIPLVEEPMLHARFGDPYAEYTRRVRRFLPRL
jgi:protein-S-isoprenylcysteine O-methyltransferase Ste14